MEVTVLQVGPIGTNCYIVREETACAVIDPGDAGDAIADWLQSHGLTPECILLTHGHYDHVGGIEALCQKHEGLPVYVHEADTHLPAQLSRGLQWTNHYDEGDTVTAGGVSFRVLSTPGHTPGSVCLLAGDHLFCGDTLFAGSCGRTDLPGGDWNTILLSLARLAKLEGNLNVLPGHGESSTLERERQYNPYMKEAMGR